MHRYVITITVPWGDKTFSSAILQIGPGGLTVSCSKQSGIEVSLLREGPYPEVVFRLLETNEELRFSLKDLGVGEAFREIHMAKAVDNSDYISSLLPYPLETL